jgi:shikimate kinase
MNWVLFGFRGCGKTTLAKEASEAFSLPYFDTDEWITRETGMSPGELVVECGVGAFEEWEEKSVLVAAELEGYLIAVGGATLLREVNVERLQGRFIYLEVARAVLKQRWEQKPHSHLSDFESVYEERLPLYEKMAERVIMPSKEQLWEVIRSDVYSKSPHGENLTARPLASS